jgi:hypothetical protein
MKSIVRTAFAFVIPTLLAAQQQQQREMQPVTISIRDAFLQQLHPPLPRKHRPEPTTVAIAAPDLITRLFIFADDSMMGRETGTEGHVRATNYLEREVRALGLTPAGDKGTFFQDIPVVLRALDPASTVSVNGTTYVAGRDFIASPGRGGGPLPTFASGVVIYNADPANPLSASDVSGKIVLSRGGGGGGGRGFGGGGRGGRGGGGSGAFESALAVATIVDALPEAQVNAALHPGEKSAVYTATAPASPAGGPPTAAPQLTITNAVAEALLGSPLANATRGMVGKTLTTNIRFIEQPKPARNVVAILPGSDPRLKNEYVVIGAHSDHVGFANAPVDHDSVRLYNARLRTQGLENRTPDTSATAAELALLRTLLDSLHKVNGIRLDSINNGADDDGSGSVTLLEIAEAFAKSPQKPKRSILFIWYVGEEKGLWGSDFFTRYATIPRDSIVATLNMDMVGRGKAEDIPLGGNDFVQPVGWRRLSPELGDLALTVNASQKLPFRFDEQYDAPFQPNNIYCRSDHAKYARFGIPIVYFTTGLHRDYHQVTDEPQYIDYAHMAGVGQLMHDLATAVANLDHRPAVTGNVPIDPYAPCVNNGVVPDSLAKKRGAP